MLTLRPYQLDAVTGIREFYVQGYRAPLAVLPTGAGKTVIFSHIAHLTVSKGKRVLILVHRIELLRQTKAALEKNGVHCGIINANYTPDPFAKVQIASVQTLVQRLGTSRQDYDLIIIDEAHHANASTWRKIIDANPRARLLGVTATPCRADGVGLGVSAGGYFDCMVLGPQPQDLMNMGYLVAPKIYAPPTALDFSDVEMVAGDYNKGQILAKVDKPTITGDAVHHYRKYADGQPCVVFCISVEHAQHVAEQFRLAGYRSEHADGSLPDDERQRRLNGLGNGEVQVLTTCDLISEGTDIPAIACAILLRPTASLGLFLQQVGRALRPSPGKDFAIILDHVGNVRMHGRPQDYREWTLEGAKRTRRSMKSDAEKIRISQCPSCYAVHLPADQCPECGHRYEVKPNRQLGKRDGELKEVTDDMQKLITLQKKSEVGRAKTLDDLIAIEKARNYKPGWAAHVWKSRQRKVLGL